MLLLNTAIALVRGTKQDNTRNWILQTLRNKGRTQVIWLSPTPLLQPGVQWLSTEPDAEKQLLRAELAQYAQAKTATDDNPCILVIEHYQPWLDDRIWSLSGPLVLCVPDLDTARRLQEAADYHGHFIECCEPPLSPS